MGLVDLSSLHVECVRCGHDVYDCDCSSGKPMLPRHDCDANHAGTCSQCWSNQSFLDRVKAAWDMCLNDGQIWKNLPQSAKDHYITQAEEFG